MTRRLGRRAGAVGALLTALVVVVPASPASADALVTIDAPRSSPPQTAAAVIVSGSAVSNAPLLYQIKSVRLTIGTKSQNVECTQQPCRFSWTVDLPLNGRYTLKGAATEATLIGTTVSPTPFEHSFDVAAPPAKPVLDAPRVNEARHVELSWSRNTEADILFYTVFRTDPGGSDFRPVGGNVPQTGPGTKVSFTDTGTSALVGGDYAYQVAAVRKGAGDKPEVALASGVRTVSVPAPPTTTSPPGAPDAGGGTGTGTGPAPTTTVKPGAAAGVDLSGFLSSRSGAAPVSPITIPEPPDTGFGGTLPFGARPPGEELEEGEAEAVPPRDSRRSVITRIDSGRPLVPVAGGLVLLLLAMHMRLLNRRIKTAEDADLPVGAGTAGPPPVPVPVAAPEPAPAPRIDLLLAEPIVLAAAPEPVPRPVAVSEAPVKPKPTPRPRAEPAPPTPVLYDVLEDEQWAPPPAPKSEPEPAPVLVPEGGIDFDVDFDFEPRPEPEPVEIEAVLDHEVEAAVDDETEPVVDVIEPVVDDVIEPVVDDVIEPVVDDEIEPVVDDEIEAAADDEIEPVVDEVEAAAVDEIEAAAEDEIEPVVDDVIEPVVDDVIEPVVDDEIEIIEVVSPSRRRLVRAGSR